MFPTPVPAAAPGNGEDHSVLPILGSCMYEPTRLPIRDVRHRAENVCAAFAQQLGFSGPTLQFVLRSAQIVGILLRDRGSPSSLRMETRRGLRE